MLCILGMLGLQSRTSHMIGKCSATGLRPHPQVVSLKTSNILLYVTERGLGATCHSNNNAIVTCVYSVTTHSEAVMSGMVSPYFPQLCC